MKEVPEHCSHFFFKKKVEKVFELQIQKPADSSVQKSRVYFIK